MNVQRKEKGFTIIEVVLVLAIAALIFLMIFIALPALQKSQRDTARKNDANIVLSAVNKYVSDNKGKLPVTVGNITPYIDNLSQYDKTSTTEFNIGTGALSALAPATQKDLMRLVTKAKCGTAGATVGGSSRQVAVQYVTESGSATGIPQCAE